MNYSRRGHGCIVVNEWLWVMGCSPEIEAIETANIDDSSWELKGALDRDISSFGIVAVDHLIYVVGGYNYTDNYHEDVMYMINTLNGHVTTLSLGFPVRSMPVVAVDGIMYGFGGWSPVENQVMDSWAVYNLLSDK